MYTLYYSPSACSLAVHALLCSLNVPFDAICVDIGKGEQRSSDYLALNPRGQVPVLLTPHGKLRESAVMAVYLAETHHSPLLPADAWPRAQALEWLGFYTSTLHQAYGNYFLMRQRLQEEHAKDAACALLAKRIAMLWREVEARLEHLPYIAGEHLTLADFFHTVIANWTTVLQHKVTLGAHTRRLCATVCGLPYMRQALETEGRSYRVLEG